MHTSTQLCPCQINPSAATQTSLSYSDCCQPYHNEIDKADGIKAENAERLMRTRYSAFVQVLPDYIVKTTLPAQQNLLNIQAIETWARETDWAGLEIVKHTPKLGKRHAQVEFKAFFNDSKHTVEGLPAHHELSTFVKVKDKANSERWYFLDPTVKMSVTQKQPCICGSGEKFKRCCGTYP
ncbi:YchJ family protein [uncultured Psychrobacter sp.]|uniref:YchJ family protein n=1 Tax=uncultured Psychrobacter sp. TaxID=259303 RepID=UPI0034590A42